jgi:transmembrane 9 superfamily protein 2/4
MAALLSMFCAMMKLLNPLKKGQTLTALLILYVLSGSVAGYISARLYKFCDADRWKLNTFYTAIGLPGIMVTIFLILNVCLSFAGAATAVSFLTILALFALWLCVSIPLVFVGSYLGFSAEQVERPNQNNKDWPSSSNLAMVFSATLFSPLGGILPFGSVCIELFFIMSALWLHQIYYVMGFLLAVLSSLRHMRRSGNRHVLPSAVFGRLQMVVEVILELRFGRIVPLPVQSLVPHVTT